MSLRNSIEQAEHNEKVCNYISAKKDFGDWVITTAFYSAIHYIRHMVLPHTSGEFVYHDFEELFANCKRDKEGRHGFQLSFVRKNHDAISVDYKRLHEMSENARYNCYNVEKEQGVLAIKYLKAIKEYTLAAKPKQ